MTTLHTGVARLSVLDLTGNLGGGTRFIRALLPALKRARPSLRITLSGTPQSVANHATADLEAGGIELQALTFYPGAPCSNWYTQSFPTRARYRWRQRRGLEPPPAEYMLQEFGRVLDAADVIYIPWPYHLAVPAVRSPLVTTVHDLNFKHFFGTPIFNREQTARLEADVAAWIQAATVVVSSEFMAGELARFYPAARPAPVVRLAPFTDPDAATGGDTNLPAGVRRPYVLCANNVTVHKNLGAVFAAKAILRERFPELQLVVAGVGTEVATGRADRLGSTAPSEDADVIGLGYVTDAQILKLIDDSELVVNASLYEAGNGPGLDAWSRGVPVAMSDIPSFTEHLTALGVEAAVFDPRDPKDIAAKVASVIADPDSSRAMADRSKTAIHKQTWGSVAERYLGVFDAAFASMLRA